MENLSIIAAVAAAAALLLAAAISFAPRADGQDAPALPPKALICAGWYGSTIPTPSYIAANAAFLESQPFNGLVVYLRNPSMSINATTEVDLIGQCASETIAGRYWSSSGGQADFARGAMYSRHGRAFVVLRSTATTPGGEVVSRIRATLTPGSVVTTLKNTVDHVVTEHGVADMRGRSISQRARSLIAVAHPAFRDELEAQARQLDYL